MKKDNLLHFPLVKRVGKIEAMKRFRMLNQEKILEQKKALLTGALASILFIMSFINSSLLDNRDMGKNPQFGARGVASINQRDLEWEHQLAAKLSVNERGIASIGYQPTLLEKLQFETLEGKYFLSFENGKIRHIEYSAHAQRNPNYVNNRELFLQKNRNLISQDFDQVEKKETKIEDQFIVENYTLMKDEKIVSSAQFKLDKHGRFLGLSIQ
ncbi:MAG: hypothetical protein KDD50_09875 [Bdellovibrionales bacterium]|nr:hypothetical protein [Bdellovibrionales bacterium]